MGIIIVLEGPDGGGKTTLAHKLCDEFGLEYRRPPEELLSSITGPSPGLSEWWQAQLRAPQKVRRQGVYDRCFWISEPIYAAVGGRQPLANGEDLQRGINDLWAEGPLLIFCMTNEATMLENAFMAGRPRLADISDDLKKMRSINFLYWAFFSVWGQALDHTFHWDYNLDKWADVVKAYEEYERVMV